MDKANRLLPCPFCDDGGEPLVELKTIKGGLRETVRCQKCRATAMLTAWQSRAGQPPAQDEANAVIAELVEALEAAIAYIGGNSVVGNQFLDLLEATQSRARAYIGKADS